MRGWLAALCLVACADAESTAPSSRCLSGASWELGLSGSPEMSPGRPCLSCHGPDGDPHFTAAGTVFEALDEPDDCNGAAGVTVEIEDAEGAIATTTTNAAGNFFFTAETTFVLPIIARVIRGDVVRTMPRFVHATSCNDCHTQTGALGAPGRVVAP